MLTTIVVPPEDRINNLQRFLKGKTPTLVCTDIASRGLDLPLVDQVLQLDFARNVVDYLHRIGRTARMGAPGKAVSFVLPSDKSLAEVVKKNMNMEEAFSRKRGFRRRIRKMEKKEMDL
jgi:ATP-dependent RNA helicase DDX27